MQKDSTMNAEKEEERNELVWKFSPLGTIVQRFRSRRRASLQDSSSSSAAAAAAAAEDKMLINKAKRKKGGWKTTPFIIANEVSEKLAMIGLHVNLITYLVEEFHMSNVQAAITLTNFNGFNNFTPLAGAYIADAFLGRYITIIIASITYAIGILLLTIDATVPSLRPPHCAENIRLRDSEDSLCLPASSAQKGFLFLAFTFFAVGSGGIKPCVAAFGADQFDQRDEKQKKQSLSFFNWYFFGLGVAILLSVTVIVYIQEHIGWSWGFGIPAIAMFISVIFFIVGSPWYRHVRSNGSPFTRLAQVLVAAYKKRDLQLPEDPKSLNYCDVGNDGVMKLKHSEQFRFLDKAAVSMPEDYLPNHTCEDGGGGGSKRSNPWRLCSVQQVEELKCIIRTSSIWATGIIFTLAHSVQNTFTIQQARSMDRHLGSFVIPPATFHVFGILALLACVPLYDRIFMPVARRFTGHERGITFLQRIGIGLSISSFAMITAALVESKRRRVALISGLENHPHQTVPYTAFWLVPQFVLIGVSESFIAIGQLEFFYDQFPEHLRSMASALFSTITALGSYLSSVMVTIVNHQTSHNGHVSWLSNNLNKGHLDYFYWLQAMLFAINFIIFLLCAHWYHYKALDLDVDVNQVGDDETKHLTISS